MTRGGRCRTTNEAEIEQNARAFFSQRIWLLTLKVLTMGSLAGSTWCSIGVLPLVEATDRAYVRSSLGAYVLRVLELSPTYHGLSWCIVVLSTFDVFFN